MPACLESLRRRGALKTEGGGGGEKIITVQECADEGACLRTGHVANSGSSAHFLVGEGCAELLGARIHFCVPDKVVAVA